MDLPPVPPGGPVRPELSDVGKLGRRLLRAAVSAARAEDAPTLPRLLAGHLGPDAGSLPVISNTWPPYEHVNVQIGIERWLARDDRSHRLIGVTGFRHRMFTLADLAQPRGSGLPGGIPGGMTIGSVTMASRPAGPGGATHPCVLCGIYLVSEGERRLALMLREGDAHGPGGPDTVVEVLCADAAAAAGAVAEIGRLALQHSVFRGQVVSFGTEMFGPGNAPLTFAERPQLSRDGLVLAPGLLESIERHVIGIGRHTERLRASGQHVKRGLLLHGPPGTGKTHTVRYLIGRLTGVTTVILSGNALHLIQAACSIARALQPSLVVAEDVDLIASHRGMHPGQHPLLFQLLNEMDGLAEDADVTFLLTTNRADLLEPALAARPGRVDHAAEFTLPDAGARRRLLRLYQGRLRIDDADLELAVERTDGMTASFLKELLRRAAVNAAETADGPPAAALTVTSENLASALDELLGVRNALTRTLLGAGEHGPGEHGAGGSGPGMGWLRAPAAQTARSVTVTAERKPQRRGDR